MANRSVMKHDFSRVPRADIQRSSFDRSHGIKTTFDSGYLIPVFVDEVLPGDTLNLKMTGFGRLATPLKPFMDNLYIDSFFWFVPNRLVWTNWQRFNGEQPNPGDSTEFLVPQVPAPTSTGWIVGSLFDYFGIPTDVDNFSVNALHSRAYNLIWNEWYRDQNLQDSVPVDVDDGPDNPADYGLLRRGKRHDYFTSALPWPQKGPGVQLPLGTSAPVVGIGMLNTVLAAPSSRSNVRESTGDLANYAAGWDTAQEPAKMVWETQNIGGSNYPNIRADLSQATAATINSLRQAFQVQRLYERDARGGTRYTEIIRAHFGVMSPDARLQRPEYLGGGTSPVNVSPVPQQSATVGGQTPQGNLAAVGQLHMHGHGFQHSFTEHGVVIGLVCVRADLNYQQGLNRMWSRRTRFDYYWPALAHLGEQAVLNKEIYLQGTADDDLVFGYQERFAEYRYKPSQITGLFRSTASGSLDIWHLAQEFGSLPLLNDTFIQDNPPVDRVIAVPSEPHFLFDGYFQYHCARRVPMYSVPGLIDHF